MLPAIVNGNLARGAFTLAKRKAIVKRLDAIQNLGGMSVLCCDKVRVFTLQVWHGTDFTDGTLTKDEIALCHHVDISGNQDQRTLQLAYVNAVNQSGKNNSIDSAILEFVDAAEKATAIAMGKKVAEIPFTFEKRRSSCIVRTPARKLLLITKGAFEEILALCNHARQGKEILQLDSSLRQNLCQRAADFNAEGYRVIAVAVKEVYECDFKDDDQLESLESSMTVEGLLTFLDPPKDDAAASIERLQDLGVDIKVLTGDNLGVALKVCRTLNLVTHVDERDVQAITGPDLAKLEGTEEFNEVVKTCRIFAKLTPGKKVKLS